MRSVILLVALMGMMTLSACVSGRPSSDTYTNKDGGTVVIEDGYQACVRSCNNESARCGDSDAARRPSIDSSQSLFGGAAMCKKALSGCLAHCMQQR